MSSIAVRIVDRSYHLHEQLGQGGMGTVYRARQLVSGQEVALKLVLDREEHGAATWRDSRNAPEGGSDTLLSTTTVPATGTAPRLALAREFQTLASLHHPNVIRVLSYGFDDELGPYFTMELLDAPRTVLEAASPQPLDGRVNLLAQLLRALAYVHQRGILHRDIKPSNVLVINNEVKLLDFGVAADMAAVTDLAGTLDFLAPELFEGRPASVASDLYSVGVLFHQMLSVALPSSREAATLAPEDLPVKTLEETTRSHAETERQNASPSPVRTPLGPREIGQGELRFATNIPDGLQRFVRKLLAPRPEERYPDAITALRELSLAARIPLPAETIATRESYLQATALIGREEELKRLLIALELARQGDGSAFLVGGESGIGKSRLLSELRTQALVRGMWAVEGQSVTNGGAYFQEWIPLLRALCFRADISDAEASVLKPLLPDIGDVLGRPIPDSEIPKTDEMPERVAATLTGLIARVQKPVLIIQEDLHWARSETRALLASIAARARGLPLLLVGTFRSDESPRLAEALPSMEVIALRRLSTQAIARLSASMLGIAGEAAELVSYLEHQTDGNAFFLVEVVRALAERAGDLRAITEGTLPETVLTFGIERILERRLGRVPSALEPLLELSATLGRKLDIPMLERAFPDIDLRKALIECANAAILESQGADWRFAHDKLREAILRRIEPGRRGALHRKVAESLEAVYEPAAREAMGATLAFHFEKAGALEKAVEYYLLAEKDAQRRNLPVEQRAHCAAAIATIKALPDAPERRRLHTDILTRQVAAGLGYIGIKDMLDYIVEARALMETIIGSEAAVPADRLRMARLDHLQGRIYQYASQSREAIVYYERVLENTKDAEAAELRFMTLSRIGLSLCYQGQFGKARRLLEGPSRRVLEERGVHSDSMRCLMYYSLALAGAGYSSEALARIEEARELTHRLNQRACLIVFQSLHYLVLITMADWPRVREHAIESIEVTRQTNEPMAEMPARDALAWAQSHLGDAANAVLNRERAAAARRTVRGGFLPDWFEAAEAEILLSAGRNEDALRHAQEVAAASRAAEQLFSLVIAERNIGVALGRLGADRAKAEAHLEESIAISRSAEQVMNEAQGELCLGQLLRERGDERSAQAHFARAIARMEAGGFVYALDRARAIAAGTA